MKENGKMGQAPGEQKRVVAYPFVLSGLRIHSDFSSKKATIGKAIDQSVTKHLHT